jgi:hypothetical protein
MSDTLYCEVHPNRETQLRCNRCGKPICTSCAVLTPVGYRCKECVKGQQAAFDTAGWIYLVLAAIVAAIGTAIAVALLSFIGFWGLLLAAIVGGGLAELISRTLGRKRNRRLPYAAVVGCVFGVLIYMFFTYAPLLLAIFSGFGDLRLLAASGFRLLLPIGYGAIIASTVFARLRGIRL